MPFGLKKEYKEFYMPKNRPEIVNVPKASYIAVRGKGDPNENGGAYSQAVSVLCAVVYTLKMSYKTDYRIEGFYDYVVPPLEGFWWQEDVVRIDGYTQIERLTALTGDHPKYLGWVSLSRVLAQKPE